MTPGHTHASKHTQREIMSGVIGARKSKCECVCVCLQISEADDHV